MSLAMKEIGVAGSLFLESMGNMYSTIGSSRSTMDREFHCKVMLKTIMVVSTSLFVYMEIPFLESVALITAIMSSLFALQVLFCIISVDVDERRSIYARMENDHMIELHRSIALSSHEAMSQGSRRKRFFPRS